MAAARIPTITQVQPGAAVSIILKADQSSGRQVQGVIAQVLTRGNHPRGIKVRLQDGRIGRVQRMVATADVQVPNPAALRRDLDVQSVVRREGNGDWGAGVGGGGATGGWGTDAAAAAAATAVSAMAVPATAPRRQQYRSERLGVRYTDVRNEDDADGPPTEMDLMSYVKQAKPKKGGGKGKGRQARAQAQPEDDGDEVANLGLDGTKDDAPTASCPVCGDFQGDEAAVAHHVDSHFR